MASRVAATNTQVGLAIEGLSNWEGAIGAYELLLIR